MRAVTASIESDTTTGCLRPWSRRLASLTDLERYALIDDTWAFVESGQQSAADYLRLASAYRDETEPAVWGAVLGGVGAIGHHLVDDEHRQHFATWVSELVTPAFSASRVGAPGG